MVFVIGLAIKFTTEGLQDVVGNYARTILPRCLVSFL